MAAVVTLVAGASFYHNIYTRTLRFRVTYEFRTPEGPRFGSHVLEYSGAPAGAFGMLGYRYVLRGEAATIHLTERATIFALLVGGPGAELLRAVGDAPRWAFIHQWHTSPRDIPFGLKRKLEIKNLPLFVSFRDRDDPRSVSVVYGVRAERMSRRNPSGAVTEWWTPAIVDRIGPVIGGGYGFVGATIERVPAGLWPLNLFNLDGEPVTRGIENRLPLVTSTDRWPWLTFDGDVFREQPHPRSQQFKPSFLKTDS